MGSMDPHRSSMASEEEPLSEQERHRRLVLPDKEMERGILLLLLLQLESIAVAVADAAAGTASELLPTKKKKRNPSRGRPRG
jgi:hypothetical protein